MGRSDSSMHGKPQTCGLFQEPDPHRPMLAHSKFDNLSTYN